MNMCSIAPINREMQIQMTVPDHYTTTRTVKPTIQPPDKHLTGPKDGELG